MRETNENIRKMAKFARYAHTKSQIKCPLTGQGLEFWEHSIRMFFLS